MLARIVTSGDSRTRITASLLIPREKSEAMSEAREILTAARQTAENILEEARRGLLEQRAAAEREGYETGLARASAILLRVEAERRKALEGVTEDAVKLAVRMASKIVSREIESDQGCVRAILAKAIRESVCGTAKIRMNPADAEALAGNVPSGASIVHDASITRGGCKMVLESGEIDMTVETQLRAFEKAMLETVGSTQ